MKQRNSNLEILRIISVLLIILFHANRMGYLDDVSHLPVTISGVLLGSWGVLGVYLFMIMSIYFMLQQTFKVRRLVNLAFQVFCYIVFYFIIYIIYNYVITHNVVAALGKLGMLLYMSLIDPLFGKYYWFVTAYFFLMILSPLLNRLIASIKGKDYKKILVVGLFIPIYAQFGYSILNDVLSFVYLYLLIGYLKKYKFDVICKTATKKKIIKWIGISIITNLLVHSIPSASARFILYGIFNFTFACTGRHSIIMMYIGILIFFYTIQKEPKVSTRINQLATLSLGVYLFHETHFDNLPNTLDAWLYTLETIGFIQRNLLFPLTLLISCIGMMGIGMIVEYIRNKYIQIPYIKYIEIKYANKLDQIDQWVNQN